MRWIQKIVRVFLVIGLGAAASVPFRLLPPPPGGPNQGSADRIVLQNDSRRAVQETPLQIAPPAAVAETSLQVGTPASPDDESPRTASKRPAQVNRRDLPAWDSKLESPAPPPALPDTFAPGNSGTGSSIAPNGSGPGNAAGDTFSPSSANGFEGSTTPQSFAPGF